MFLEEEYEDYKSWIEDLRSMERFWDKMERLNVERYNRMFDEKDEEE